MAARETADVAAMPRLAVSLTDCGGAAGDGWLHDTRPTATATRTAAAEAAAANANANATSSPILGAAATTKSVHSEKLKGIYI